MKNGYNVSWTEHALNELAATISYLEKKWTEKELRNFSVKLEQTIILISQNPNLFPSSDVKKDIHRAVIAKHNTLYYRVKITRSKLYRSSLIAKTQKKGN